MEGTGVCNIYVYGFADFDSYGYPSGLALGNLSP